jgi:hypothetical protein
LGKGFSVKNGVVNVNVFNWTILDDSSVTVEDNTLKATGEVVNTTASLSSGEVSRTTLIL